MRVKHTAVVWDVSSEMWLEKKGNDTRIHRCWSGNYYLSVKHWISEVHGNVHTACQLRNVICKQFLIADWRILTNIYVVIQLFYDYAPAPVGEVGALGGHRRLSSVRLSVRPSVCLMSRTSALTRKPKGLGRRKFAQGYPRSHATPTPTSRSKGQKSRSRGEGILWWPPSRTACYYYYYYYIIITIPPSLPLNFLSEPWLVPTPSITT